MGVHSLSKFTPYIAVTCICFASAVHSLTHYANLFLDPNLVITFNQTSSGAAQHTITQWAQSTVLEGPWAVTNKTILPASQDKHDYMSFSPYAWPDCSGAGNTTVLTKEQIWTTCPYVTRDGQFNPDARDVNDIDSFENLADGVLYNAITSQITGSTEYANNAAKFIRAWFLDDQTAMNPSLNFAQIRRGPGGQNGTHTGVLDLKCMTKVVNGVLILRQGQANAWSSDDDNQMNAWAEKYISWLQTAPIAIEESTWPNNHGTFFYNQLAALQIMVGDNAGARKTLETYFTTLFKNQISADGEQPEEAKRTRPYHYRSYNLAAMITNARLGSYVGYDTWNLTTSSGATIQTALDFAIAQPSGDDDATELYPNVAAVGE
ncbi:chondroitin AC/alginate lyase [Panus rudis PR-1116 ss-1]|nr:chondroitin AC/alginate lyase [Panus rudis PR-1116 ss-1]